jgi:hypothetical protein
MSALDNFTDGLLEMYNMERQILLEMLAAANVKITAENLRNEARRRLEMPVNDPSYDGGTDTPDNEPPSVEPLDG